MSPEQLAKLIFDNADDPSKDAEMLDLLGGMSTPDVFAVLSELTFPGGIKHWEKIGDMDYPVSDASREHRETIQRANARWADKGRSTYPAFRLILDRVNSSASLTAPTVRQGAKRHR